MALFSPQPKERRKNRDRGVPPEAYVERYARLHKTLVDIANMTKREMPDDDEFRLWAQDAAHTAIEEAGRVK